MPMTYLSCQSLVLLLAVAALISSARGSEPAAGWQGLVPGMGFEEAATLEIPFRWTEESLAGCRAQLPEKSCALLTEDRASIAGIVFAPLAIFSRTQRLSVLNLEAETSSGTPAACARNFAQVLGTLEDKYGRMTDPRQEVRAETPPSPRWYETKLGGRYYIHPGAAIWTPETGPVVTNDPAAYNAPYPAPMPPHVSLEAQFAESCTLLIEFKARAGSTSKEN